MLDLSKRLRHHVGLHLKCCDLLELDYLVGYALAHEMVFNIDVL